MSTKFAQPRQKRKFRRPLEFTAENFIKIAKLEATRERRFTIFRGLGRGLNEKLEFGGAAILWGPIGRILVFRGVTVSEEKKLNCGDNFRTIPFPGF
ncbi:hypothetical protein J2W51_001516 [Tardiphaga robiniae]|uniref:hypothetical protein n=1 Tax=Tardiphaga robiniae TaxID=943830 RepID=UPI00285B1264|nr:hypothetical protein [Tardiphaga robiniae]MDR6658974.1 hypothetical protein [Tardiphaga robiniae]